MNKQRREELQKAIELLEQANSIIEDCNQQETEYFDNIPESLQNGQRGELSNNAINSMEEAYQSIEESISSIEEAMSN